MGGDAAFRRHPFFVGGLWARGGSCWCLVLVPVHGAFMTIQVQVY